MPLVSLGNPPLGPTVLDMASAFGTLANDGIHCPAHAIRSVADRQGTSLPRPDEVVLALESEQVPRRHPEERLAERPGQLQDRDTGPCYGVADPDRVRSMNQTLTRVPTETTGTRADIDRPQAGKTGTANDETFAWYVGYTPDIAIAVHVSDPLRDSDRLESGETRQPMHDVAGLSRVYGGTIPALIWRVAAEAILADVPPSEFPEPGELVDPDSIVGPARPKPQVTVRPTSRPTPTETSSPDDGSTEEPGSGDTPTTDPPPTDPGDGGGDEDDDGDGCFLVFCG